MLLLEDGRIQSAGHPHTPHSHNFYNGRSSKELGEIGILKVARECSGVTGACMMIGRSADVDLCFKLLNRGYRTI